MIVPEKPAVRDLSGWRQVSLFGNSSSFTSSVSSIFFKHLYNIVQYHQIELATTLVLAAATYTFINSSIASTILISGISFIVGKSSQIVNRNIETREVITGDPCISVSEGKLEEVDRSSIETGSRVITGVQPDPMDEDLLRLRNENQLLERKLINTEKQLGEWGAKIAEQDAIMRELVIRQQQGKLEEDQEPPRSGYVDDSKKDAEIKDAIESLEESNKRFIILHVRQINNKPEASQFKEQCYQAIARNKLPEFLNSLAVQIKQATEQQPASSSSSGGGGVNRLIFRDRTFFFG
ncbi:MAG: hypothetical protein K1060chlam4_01498 [Candidatus Anoxychlamydiales bacterium]|nr:hypothetical protein [Candidatus Anoxychlamydiales bacterium]